MDKFPTSTTSEVHDGRNLVLTHRPSPIPTIRENSPHLTHTNLKRRRAKPSTSLILIATLEQHLFETRLVRSNLSPFIYFVSLDRCVSWIVFLEYCLEFGVKFLRHPDFDSVSKWHLPHRTEANH